MYCFYVDYTNGRKTRELGLTKRQAVMKYNKLGKTDWTSEVLRFGWREIRGQTRCKAYVGETAVFIRGRQLWTIGGLGVALSISECNSVALLEKIFSGQKQFEYGHFKKFSYGIFRL